MARLTINLNLIYYS